MKECSCTLLQRSRRNQMRKHEKHREGRNIGRGCTRNNHKRFVIRAWVGCWRFGEPSAFQDPIRWVWQDLIKKLILNDIGFDRVNNAVRTKLVDSFLELHLGIDSGLFWMILEKFINVAASKLYHTILININQYYTILYNIIQYYTILYNIIQYYTILYI